MKLGKAGSANLFSSTSLLLAALFFSGAAGIINQVIWQRALKIYLAGSEAISSMIIVLVFMLGLGLGSLVMGLRAHKLKNPLRTLGFIELALFAVNLGITFLLGMDLSDSVYAFEKCALSSGVPLRAV